LFAVNELTAKAVRGLKERGFRTFVKVIENSVLAEMVVFGRVTLTVFEESEQFTPKLIEL
jgi:hypothetical protein